MNSVATLLVLVAFAANILAEPVPVNDVNQYQPTQTINGAQASTQWNDGLPHQLYNGNQPNNQGPPAAHITQDVFGFISGLFNRIGGLVSDIFSRVHNNRPGNNNPGNNNPGNPNGNGASSAVGGPQGLQSLPIVANPSGLPIQQPIVPQITLPQTVGPLQPQLPPVPVIGTNPAPVVPPTTI